MKTIRSILSAGLFAAAFTGTNLSAAGAESGKPPAPTAVVGEAAPAFTLPGVDGKAHALKDYAGSYVVLEWINFGCPFVRKHYDSDNMQSLQAASAARDVVWLTICSSAPGKQGYFEGDELKEQVEASRSKARAYLVDAEGAVGRAYGAKTTPHMFIIDPKGTLIYAGAIDDRPTTDKADIKSATNYVKAALDAAMAGKKVETAVTQAYGCSVKYKP